MKAQGLETYVWIDRNDCAVELSEAEMTDIIRKTAVFVRANAESSRGQRAAAALADMIDGKITADEGLAALSECLGCELQIKSTVPNEATAFVVFSAREIRSAFDN